MKQSFEDLIVWQEAERLTVSIYEIFREHRDFGFRDQICRASVSIMNNLAEGYERTGIKDKIKFYIIAKGSNAEVRSMLHLALKLGYLTQDQYDGMIKQVFGIASLLWKLIESIKD